MFGVLVAISIPIFTSQLEKSREATDIANVRSAYAEMMTGVLTGESTFAPSVSDVTIEQTTAPTASAAGVYTATVSNLKQRQAGWQTTTDLNIGGVEPTGTPTGTTTSTAVIVYTEAYNTTAASLTITFN